MTATQPAATSDDLTLDLRRLGTVLSIWAHPDDETYLAGGVMAALRDRGQRVVCVTASRGESADDLATPEERVELAAVRSHELSAALATLGVDEHHWLNVPDGKMDRFDSSGPIERIVDLLDDVAPDTVLTFGPDGVTGHPDHRAVNRWVHGAIDVSGVSPVILHPVASGRAIEVELAQEFDMWMLGGPRQCRVDKVVLRVDLCGEALDRKVSALLQQRSQTAELAEAVGLDRYRAWVSVETYAYPGHTLQ